MLDVHLVLPPVVIKRLSKRYVMRHKDGATGYFCVLTPDEFWNITRSLSNSGYRVDIKPGKAIRLMARLAA